MASTAQSPCWNCGRGDPRQDFFCAVCGALQPPPDGSLFVYLGLPAAYALDIAHLRQLIRERSRLLHPDRFAAKSPRERRLSLEHSMLLNEAGRVLGDPFRRLSLLLKMRGVEAAESGSAGIPPALLMEMMELREELADAIQDNQPGRLLELDRAMRQRMDRLLADTGAWTDANWTREWSAEEKDRLRRSLTELKFCDSYLHEWDQRAGHLKDEG
ncbi:MAG: Co-chaperone protein HscB [Myxococcota bacterium]|nr:Co-chaperone protein HscB [Myxococcota bacterium]